MTWERGIHTGGTVSTSTPSLGHMEQGPGVESLSSQSQLGAHKTEPSSFTHQWVSRSTGPLPGSNLLWMESRSPFRPKDSGGAVWVQVQGVGVKYHTGHEWQPTRPLPRRVLRTREQGSLRQDLKNVTTHLLVVVRTDVGKSRMTVVG